MANIEFLSADALNMQLFQRGDLVWGADRKQMDFGPWTLSLWIEAHSTVANGKECGLLVSITKRLWLYLTVDGRRTRLAVFDAVESGVDGKTRDSFAASSTDETLKRLKVKAMFKFENEKWVTAPLPAIDCTNLTNAQ